MLKLKSFRLVTIAIIVFLAMVIVYISNHTIDTKTEQILQQAYSTTQKNLSQQIDLLVKGKLESTLTLALTLSRDKRIIEALKSSENGANLDKDLKNLSSEINQYTGYKNVWFQIISSEGKNFYRSWTDDRGAKIYQKRLDMKEMIKFPKIISSIGVGKFDMTLKGMVPIYDIDEKYLGIFEVITHFNSIAKKLEEDNLYPLIIADKRYKEQLTMPFTKEFIGDYYIATLEPNPFALQMAQDQGVEKFFADEDSFLVDTKNNFFSMNYPLKGIQNETVGHIIIFKKLDSFIIDEISTVKKDITFIMFLSLIFIVVFGYYLLNQRYSAMLKQNLKTIQKDKDIIHAILSAQPYIIILIHNDKSYDVNDKFFEFFSQYKTLEDFKKEHACICDFFINPDSDENYVEKKENWIEDILQNTQNEYKVAMKKEDEICHFIVKATRPHIKNEKDDFVILTFVDITELRIKDRLLYEQSKNASMGEMIGNIAHQWRQPLSVISTGATGMLLQKEFNQLSDEMFINTCNLINENTQYLSKTIDDFRDFIKGDSTKESFSIHDTIDSFLHLVDSTLQKEQIKVILNIQQEIEMMGYPNEILQCLMNLFNNSKDALKEKNIEEKYIFINIFLGKNIVEIQFKDNAGGINHELMDKIFEPYFTTKHKSLGTGLGLHMTYNLITSHMKGEIIAQNDIYSYNGKEYHGLELRILIPYEL